jgi:TM2 domain-containing membrane protein YozV
MSEPGSKNRVVAALLAIFLGYLGVHRFYMGDVTGGIIRIVICFGAFGLIPLIEGIIYLTKTDEAFEAEYVVGGKKWF